jgi:predicted nucleotide-binding protein
VPGNAVSELRGLAERAKAFEMRGEDRAVADPLTLLEKASEKVGRAWSGSCFGFHARVYYANLEPPPPGAHFSSEWGFIGLTQGTTGDWEEYPHEATVAAVRHEAGNPDLTEVRALAEEARSAWKAVRAEIVSILSVYLSARSDALLDGLKAEAEAVRDLTASRVARALLPKGQVMSRDTTALTQGLMVAPHQEVWADVVALRGAFTTCGTVADIAERAATHIERLEEDRLQTPTAVPGQRVFIGHGRSLAWRELKDFVSDRLRLPWDEFNRLPVAGVTNIARLSEMLNHAAIAFLVLSAEDETADGHERARQNVVHEAGLFQGRLGFARAIILLEEGCEEFSNIQGLGQIRFPTGRISASFEEVRAVLEREGLLDPS